MSGADRLSGWSPGVPLVALGQRIERVADRLGGHRWWAPLTALAATVVGVLLAFPTYESVGALGRGEQWRYILSASGGDLVTQDGVATDTRPINLTWRFVPRLLGGALGFDSPWQYLVLQAAFGVLMLWALAKLLDQALSQRSMAIITTIGVAGTWAGATSWMELRGNLDAMALAFVLLAMLSRRSAVVAQPRRLGRPAGSGARLVAGDGLLGETCA